MHAGESTYPGQADVQLGLSLCQATRLNNTESLPESWEAREIPGGLPKSSAQAWWKELLENSIPRTYTHWKAHPAWEHVSVGIYRYVTEADYHLVININMDITQEAINTLFDEAKRRVARGDAIAHIHKRFLERLYMEKQGGYERIRTALYRVVEQTFREHAKLLAPQQHFKVTLAGSGLGASLVQSIFEGMFHTWKRNSTHKPAYRLLRDFTCLTYLSPGAEVIHCQEIEKTRIQEGYIIPGCPTFSEATRHMTEVGYDTVGNLLGRSICRRLLVPRISIETPSTPTASLCFLSGAAGGGGSGEFTEGDAVAESIPPERRVIPWETFYRDASAALSHASTLKMQSKKVVKHRPYGAKHWLAQAAIHGTPLEVVSHRHDDSSDEVKSLEVALPI